MYKPGKSLIAGTREKSILTGGKVNPLAMVINFPIFIGATDASAEEDILPSLIFDICKESGMIQLRHLMDPEIIYSKYHSEAIGPTWNEHHDLLASVISKYSKNKSVLEIGGSNGVLATKTLNLNPKIKEWTMVEPNISEDNYLDDERINYLEDFFNKKSVKSLKSAYQIVVHSHTLEHAYDPKEMLTNI